MKKNDIWLFDLKQPLLEAKVPDDVDKYWIMNEHIRIMRALGIPCAPYLKAVRADDSEGTK